MKSGMQMLLLLLGMVMAGACTNDAYESGDGRYSYLRADFCMLHAAGSGLADYALTDDGDTLRFSSPATVLWAMQPDSLYRALVYHDVSRRTLFGASRVMVVQPMLPSDSATVSTDPLTIESAWAAGGYLNIGFAVKTGQSDSIEVRQQLGLLLEQASVDASGKRTIALRVTHAQNGMPEYYTVRGYMSMPLAEGMQGATIRLSANTYRGTICREIEL